MLFSSVEFLFRFLPVFMLLYLIVPARYRNFVLLAGSLVFYGVGEPYFVLLLIFSVVVNYGISKYMFWEPAAPIQNRVQRRVKRRRAALIISLVFDFSLLFLFKYWDFAAGTVNQLAGSELIPVLALTLPLGISFYTFQMVSYQVDCYRGVIEKPPGFVPFAAYVSMFPQLIAGPIVRYDEVADRMCGRRMRIRNLENGLKLFTLGLGLKVTGQEEILVRGKKVTGRDRKVVLAYYKPKGVICTERDAHAEKIVTDEIKYPVRVTYAGRLDKDSEGLLLLTNDGMLIEAMMRGANGHEKEYIVKTSKEWTKDALDCLRQGVYLEELKVRTKPCTIEQTGPKTIRLILTQGLNRQIRRMCRTQNYTVTSLKRTRVINIKIDGLKPGEYRELTQDEMDGLYRHCGLHL